MGLFGLFDPDNPQRTGELGLGLSTAGAAMSVIGAFAGAQAQKDQLKFQADIARINQAIAEGNARTAMMLGQREDQGVRLRTAQLKSGQEAAMAANGIDLHEGSAARVRASTDFMGETDANTVAANAVRQAWGYKTQAVNFGIDASSRDAAAGAVSPLMAAGSSLLTNASQVAGQWYRMKKGP